MYQHMTAQLLQGTVSYKAWNTPADYPSWECIPDKRQFRDNKFNPLQYGARKQNSLEGCNSRLVSTHQISDAFILTSAMECDIQQENSAHPKENSPTDLMDAAIPMSNISIHIYLYNKLCNMP